MENIKKELEEGVFLREITDERIALYNLMRKKFPKGKKEMQLRMSMEISDDRIDVYMKTFSEYK